MKVGGEWGKTGHASKGESLAFLNDIMKEKFIGAD